MIYSATLTQKGQVTIPVEIRRLLGLIPYHKVIFIKEEDHAVIKPSQDFLKLKGSIKGKPKFTDKVADKHILRFISKKYAEKSTRS